MAFSVSTIQDYVQANEKQLLGKVFSVAKTLSNVTIQPGVKGSAYVNLLNGGATLQAGSCSFDASGSTTITRREIKTSTIKVNESLCDKDLNTTFLSWGVSAAADPKTLPFEQMFMDQKVASVSLKNDLLFWGGDSAASTKYGSLSLNETKLADGMLKILGAVSGSTIKLLEPSMVIV